MAYTALYDMVKARSENWHGDISQVAHHFLTCWPPAAVALNKQDIKVITLTCYPQAGVVRVVFRCPDELLKRAFNALMNVEGLIPTLLLHMASDEEIDAIITALGEVRYEGKRDG